MYLRFYHQLLFVVQGDILKAFKMIAKILALSTVLGIATSTPTNIAPYPGHEVVVKPDLLSFILDIASKIIGHKISAVSCAVSIIEWVVSNIFVIMMGATSVLGLCKLTNKCSMAYEVPSVVELQSYLSPERLETAQRFLITAVDKYAKKRKRSA